MGFCLALRNLHMQRTVEHVSLLCTFWLLSSKHGHKLMEPPGLDTTSLALTKSSLIGSFRLHNSLVSHPLRRALSLRREIERSNLIVQPSLALTAFALVPRIS
jgi:hypothetical protein